MALPEYSQYITPPKFVLHIFTMKHSSTGLGLSLRYDIIDKVLEVRLEVNFQKGSDVEFTFISQYHTK